MPPRKKLTVGTGTATTDEAMKLLRKIACLVSPLMEKRGWILPLLREFQPEDKCLLGVNVNRGREIRLRLRYPDSQGAFYDEDFVLGTMLHELTHNIRGPHDAEFYKNLDMLTKEHEDNVAKGWKGVGFDGIGIRLGQGVSHDLDPHKAKETALKAAEQRAKLNKNIIPAGGRKLGSGSNSDLKMLEQVLTPREMAAMAAERRMRDRVWCGSAESNDCGGELGKGASAGGSNGTAKSRPTSASTRVYYIDSSDSEEGNIDRDELLPSTKKRRSRSPSAEISSKKPELGGHIDASKKTSSPSNWICSSCTWPLNMSNSVFCEACFVSATSTSPTSNDKFGDSAWTCESCSLVNDISATACGACDRPSPALLAELEL
ncbi:WLM domain-containing protein [Obelidium mucronatum]|nr:WLM domain-containing protein [Obelidium mucronatum]